MDVAAKAAPRYFPRALPSGNPSEQPCKPLENPDHPSSFTWINPLVIVVTVSHKDLFKKKYSLSSMVWPSGYLLILN